MHSSFKREKGDNKQKNGIKKDSQEKDQDKDKEKKGRFSCNESIPFHFSGVRSAIARGWKGLKRNQEPECKAERD